ncbi:MULTISPECIES: diguanylate cyclase [Dickeya]|uniref:diguanylate cyclase n=1 Tax=Dickeya TaxID=204037 RepID=UPI0003A8D065|nr:MULTISPECIES: diguanylate cyclase [Dickeya]UGA49164.1 diguanylate cyclase [Dickeya fangzhongdai]UMB74843.1 diguanylate cyclase [Dickeya fangzhongdai]UWH05523.1 diguanylate cyclase [Dickeya fangzhongdai]
MHTEQRDNSELLLTEWQELVNLTPSGAHQLLSDLCEEELRQLVSVFYDYMLQDKQASLYLNTQKVADKLSESMYHWLRSVLGSAKGSLSVLLERQQQVGVIHARIGIPTDLVARGARKLKNELFKLLARKRNLDAALINQAVCFSSLVMDTAIEAMTTAYSPGYKSAMRDQERYRILSIYDDVNVERERQLGALMNWENQFIYNVATGLPSEEIILLEKSEFGLWFFHKGRHLFNGPDLLQKLEGLIRQVDSRVRETFPHHVENTAIRTQLLRDIRQLIGQVNAILCSMFDELIRFENGKDPLTNLLNRRFIPTIMRREIALAISSGKPFILAMIDIDHFKKINDSYGHETGNLTLKTIATKIYESVRSSDYVFRYGGEEFMVLLVETQAQQASMIFDSIRQMVAGLSIPAMAEQGVSVTISVGIAEFDNHPDYQQLIKKADSALYQAKANGRNRIEIFN